VTLVKGQASIKIKRNVKIVMAKEIMKSNSKILGFVEWSCLYEDEIYIELAESGADRELDFDLELELEKRYEEYLDKQ